MPDKKLETILQLAGKAKNWKEADSRTRTSHGQDGGMLEIQGKYITSIGLDYIRFHTTYHSTVKGPKGRVDIFVTCVEGSNRDGWGAYETGGIDPDKWYGLFAYLNGIKGTELGNYTGNKTASHNKINPRIKELYESIHAQYQQKQEEKERKRELKIQREQESALEKARSLLK